MLPQDQTQSAPAPTGAAPALELDHVSKRYADVAETAVTAVDGVSLAIDTGEFVVIGGRSGSGKTTLLNLAAGLLTPTSGAVRLDGVDLSDLSDDERSGLRNAAVGFVFQFPSLVPTLSALENVMLPHAFGPGSGADPEPRARELLDLVGIGEKAGSYPRQLSAGQQQRVVLARALINRPRVIFADEPTSNLDERTEAEMMALFRDVHGSTGVTIVMVTHAVGLMAHGTRTITMAEGRIVPRDRTEVTA